MASVLLVTADPGMREDLGDRLEREGHDVTMCSGPVAPGYRCVGVRGLGCALVGPAEVVVLDMLLPGDDVLEGVSAAELLAFYRASGKPVVAFGPAPVRADGPPDAQVGARGPAPTPADIVEVVGGLTGTHRDASS
jgi:hypothetical protein